MKLIDELALIVEQGSPIFYDWNRKSAGQPIFDYIRKHEGDVDGNHIPYVYDDGAKWVYNKQKKMKMPPKYADGTQYGTLTIGWGTTDPSTIKNYSGKTMTNAEAKKLSVPDIQKAANCIKRWQRDTVKGDHNQRRLTLSMYMAMVDIAYNKGCRGFRNTKTISQIEKGKFKTAQSWIRDSLNWGHEGRGNETADLFCRDGGCIDN